jgi:hypothetical protein
MPPARSARLAGRVRAGDCTPSNRYAACATDSEVQVQLDGKQLYWLAQSRQRGSAGWQKQLCIGWRQAKLGQSQARPIASRVEGSRGTAVGPPHRATPSMYERLQGDGVAHALPAAASCRGTLIRKDGCPPTFCRCDTVALASSSNSGTSSPVRSYSTSDGLFPTPAGQDSGEEAVASARRAGRQGGGGGGLQSSAVTAIPPQIAKRPLRPSPSPKIPPHIPRHTAAHGLYPFVIATFFQSFFNASSP